MPRNQRGRSINCSNNPENESDGEPTPTSLTRSSRPSRQGTLTVSDEGSVNENPENLCLVTRTLEGSTSEENTTRTVISSFCRSLPSWLIQIICLITTLRNTIYKAQLCPQYIGWTQTGAATLRKLLHKVVEKLAILFFCTFAFWCIVICLPTKLDIRRMNMMTAGGTIDFEHTSATYSCDKARSYWSWFRLWNYARPPDVILEPNVTPGNCWAFSGDQGQVVIRLARRIFLTNITIQHIPKTISLSGNLDTAPKDFVVYGINDKSKEETFLGAFLFQPENSIQMFPLKNTLTKPFNCIKLKILTNWGNPHFTCLYRVRAHGTMSQPMSEY
ncbi:SUN domain-containing protein 5 [Vombatus ursinus]|uniref:SUN domain-containing protein 5 n=1 Tax=Vombatus ursinus TaxID=29139 RepID=UPI000FFD6574|nr:SUN domain-containing protein 5 [Vombatus ursinus]